MKNVTYLLFFAWSMITLATSAQTTAGILDLTFNSTGKVVYNKDRYDLYQDIKIQPDGKIVAVGSSMSPTFSSVIEVSRYLEDGSPDPSFGTDGHFNYSADVETMAYKCCLRDDGKILIAGHTTNYSSWNMLVIQLDEYGVPDPSFGDMGVAAFSPGPGENILSAILLQEDGKILISGYSQNQDYRNAPFLARLTSEGLPDMEFGVDGMFSLPVIESDNEFSALGIQSDGRILAAGHISNGMNWYSLLIARFQTNGSLDTTYGTQGIVNLSINDVDDEFFDLQVTAQDETILCGFTVTSADYYYHALVMKFDTSGQVIPSFGDNGKVILGSVPYSFADALMLQTDGKVVFSGSSGELAPGNNDWALWRLNTDGSIDDSFGDNGVTITDFHGQADEALGIALYSDKILLGGKARDSEGYMDFALARYTNDISYNVSVKDLQPVAKLSVYPNPVQREREIKLSTSKPFQSSIVEIVNPLGQVVFRMHVNQVEGTKTGVALTIPSSLSTGLYFVRLTTNSATLSSSLVVIE